MKPRAIHTLVSRKGFTLIELLVVISIIGLITAVIVFNQSDFADRLSLTNTVNDIELQIREAQVYGIGVREFQPSTNEFSVAYGVSFNLNNSGSSNNSYFYFADREPQNGVHNSPTSCTPNGTAECLGRLYFSRGNIISRLCAVSASGSEACSPGVGRIDVTFVRPNPSARIVFFNNSGTQTLPFSDTRAARIEVRSPKGKLQSVYIYTTGQIAIQ
jgi:prepilin-type N-terminal cleavage/methylation domain-containing protein